MTDPNTGKKSFSRTASFLSFNVILVKFLMSGLEFKGYKIPEFSASDFTIAIGAVIGLYNVSKFVDKKKDENQPEEKESE
jgi:hypothetical protein